MLPTPPARFPYMFWARQESSLSPYCLSQSGMPVPDSSFLEGVGIDITPPAAEVGPELAGKLAEYFSVSPERVLVTIGASSAMHFVAMRWFREGARIATETPSYEALRALPGLFGAKQCPLHRSAEKGWLVDDADVRKALGEEPGNGPGHVFLTNLHNPSGVLLDADRVRRIAAEADREGGVLIHSEVYMEYVPRAKRVHAFALAPNVVSIGSLTKAYGLGALRVGWIVLGEGLADQLDSLLDASFLAYVDPSTPALQGAIRALDHLPELRRPIDEVARRSRPHWERWLRDTPGITATVPEHGIIAFPRIEGVSDTRELGRHLQTKHGVDVVPGEFFGLGGHLRIACGVDEETMIEGLRRLGEGIESFRASC
jgi:aspartate/methionine/tyrosine aminotransferase